MDTTPDTLPRPSANRPWSPAPRRGGVVGPLILIVVGGVLLLQNLGYLPWSLWRDIWRLWPLVLVLVGLELLLGNRIRGTTLALVIALLAILGVVALGAAEWSSVVRSGTLQPRTFSQSLQGANQVAVAIRFGAGELTLGPLANRAGDQLATMSYQGPAGTGLEARYAVTSGVGRLEYLTSGRGAWWGWWPWVAGTGTPRMDVLLAPDVPLTLDVQTGAATADLDLSRLRVTNLELSTGATTTRVRLPEAAGTTLAHASTGATTLTIEVPAGVAAQIRHQGGLSTLNVDQARFPATGPQLYRSSDYDTAQNRVDLTLETGVSTVTIR